MKINYLEIKGFKSIQNIELKDVSPFMVLAGANGTGKSNFVDALAFLSKVIDMGVSKAVSEFGGVKNLIDPKQENEIISYRVNAEIEEQVYEYEIDILLSKSSLLPSLPTVPVSVKHEYLKIFKNGKTIFDSSEEARKLELKKKEGNENKFAEYLSSILLGITGGTVLGALKNSDEMSKEIAKGAMTGIILKFLSDNKNSLDTSILHQNNSFNLLKDVKIFRIDPFKIKDLRNNANNPEKLNTDGSNIAAVLEHLEDNDQLREQIIEWMSVIVPEMQELSVQTQKVDDSKGLFFEEDSGNRFPAHMVSDGTIYALCLLVAVLTRVKQPGITIIEEPERGLHPKAISELIGFIREHVSPHHPIILTTHSESVVRSLELEELYFVSKSQGKTQIKDVRKSGVDKNKIPLDTAWLTNLLGGGLPW